MANFSKLPFDVSECIVYFATDVVYEDLSVWKLHLPYSAVCQEWREAARRYILNQVIINQQPVDSHKRTGSTAAKTLTNITLIKRLGLLSKVKSLAFKDTRDIPRAIPLADIADVLSFEKVTRSKMATQHSRDRRVRETPTGDPYFNPDQDYAVKLAHYICRMMPNIAMLHLETHFSLSHTGYFYDELCRFYARQLKTYTARVPSFEPDFSSSTQLRRVDMSYTGNNQGRINPRSIREFVGYCEGTEFCWSMFHCDGTSNTIVLDELQSFILGGNSYHTPDDEDQEFLQNLDYFEVEIPKLQMVIIEDVSISFKTAKFLVQSTLDSLVFWGSTTSALNLCNQDISGLDSLRMVFGTRENLRFDATFVEHTNTMFSKARGIPMVEIFIKSLSVFPRFIRLNWDGVTSLQLAVNVDLVELLATIPAMTCLKDLAVGWGHFDSNTMADVTMRLNNLKKSHPGPSLSNLERFLLVCVRLNPTYKFTQAITGLSWYFPKLKKSIALQSQASSPFEPQMFRMSPYITVPSHMMLPQFLGAFQ